MSAKFNAALTDAEWAVFKAGRDLALRDDWMQRARNGKGNPALVTVCVNAARERNHGYLKAVATWRALKQPKRKRA